MSPQEDCTATEEPPRLSFIQKRDIIQLHSDVKISSIALPPEHTKKILITKREDTIYYT